MAGRLIVLLILVLSTAMNVEAQIYGLSVGDTALPQGKGLTRISGAIMSGDDDSTLYGGRLGYGVTERFLLSADVGVYETEYADPETIAQAVATYALSTELPLDLALRMTLVPYIQSYEYYLETSFSVLASRSLDQRNQWVLYGSAGVLHQQWELELAISATRTYADEGDQTEGHFSAGTMYQPSDRLSFFLEAVRVKHVFWGGGARIRL